MNYQRMRRKDFLANQLDELSNEEAETEYAIEYLPRTIKVHGKKQVIRLPRYIWVSFDRLMSKDIMSIEELLEMSQKGWEDRPGRTYQRNLEDYIQFLIHRLGNYL